MLGLKEWIERLNGIKIIAIIVVNSLLLTGVYGQAIAGVMESERATEQFKQIFEDVDVPYSYGKITAGKYEGSDSVVINIQDLHNHAEVQKNISNIIKVFDEKYGVKRVYVEGAYGEVSTKWLTVIKEKKVKDEVIETLLKAGRLTGAEYYSAKENKAEIIKGLEKKEEYLDNLKRLGTIIENQETVAMHIEAIKETVKELQKKYYNKQQKKIEKLSKEYVSGKETAKKYFEKLEKYAKKLAIDTGEYENLSMYMELLDKQKEIDTKRATRELQKFVLNIKENVPYGVYSKLLSMTNNFKQTDKLYGYLIRLSRQYDMNLTKNYKELEKLFEYMELSQAINPLELVKEEQNFKDELNDRFSVNKVEQEIIFLSNFIKYYEEYLSGKITANDCKYYNKNIEKFKNVWVKYIDNREIVALEEYEKISDEFYKINMARNEYFMENMKEILKSKKIGEEVKGETEIQKSMNSLKEAKDIYITVTGGFHTQELSKMLSKEGITNIIITPNVTTGVKEAQKTYYEIAKEQAKISFQALSTLLTSSMPNTEKILELFKVAEKKQISKSEFEKSIKELVIEFNKEQSANEQPEIRVEMASEKEIIINDKKYRYEGNKVIEEEIKADKNKGMQKSVKSVKETIQKTVIISVGLSIITLALIPISILTGSFPVVAMIVGESISAIGAVFSWMTVIFKNSQINFLNNKRAKEIKERITKNKITESDGVSEEIKNKIKDKFIELGFKEEEIGTPDKELGENEFAEVKVKKAERGEKEFLHINYSLINKLFMDGTEFKDDVISNAYLRMFIEHELRHRNNTKWSEWQVSFFDIFSFIKAFIREIFKGSNIEEKKKEVVEKLIEETEGDFKEEDLDRALEGKEESYKNKVIGLLNKFLKNGGLIVNCAVKSLQAVINAQSIWQIAIQTMLTEISTEMFVKNNEKNINGGNTSIKTSMSTMKKVMDEEEYKAEGYETDANTLMENLKEGESAIVWVNKNHYITVTKLESEKYSISDPNVNGGKEIIYATKLLLNGMTVTLQSGEQVRYKTKDGKITVLSASEGLKEAVKSGQGNIRILSNKNMEKITGAGGYKKDINIIDAKFYDKDGVTCVDIIYTKDGGITRKKKSFKYKEKLTDPVKIKVKNHYKKYGMTDAEWVRTNGLDIPNMKQQIKNINNKKITKKVAGHGNINRNLKQKEHKEIKKINDKRIINNIEKNDKKVENKTSVVKNKDHNVDINQNINEVNKKNEVNKNQSNSKDEYNKRNIKNDKIENSNNQNDDNYIKQLKSVNDLINEQLSRLKNKSFRVVVFKKGEIKQIKDLLKVYLQKNNEVIDMKSLKDFVGLLEQEIKRDETIISLPAFRVSFIKNIADTELKKYNQNNQNNIKPKNSQVGNNGKNIGKNIRETKNIKHNDLKNKININNKDNNIIKKANDIEVNRIKEKGNINKISDKNETVKGIKVNENININIKKINNKKETNNIKKEIEKNKISIINKGVNNIDISQEVNEEKEKKRKRLEDYRGKLEKFLNLFSDNNVVTTGNNIILNKEQSKVIDDFLFYLMIDIFSIKGKYSELYNKFYEFIQYLKYQKDLIKDDKVELSKEKIKEIKKIVSEELEEQKNQNISTICSH